MAFVIEDSRGRTWEIVAMIGLPTTFDSLRADMGQQEAPFEHLCAVDATLVFRMVNPPRLQVPNDVMDLLQTHDYSGHLTYESPDGRVWPKPSEEPRTVLED